jgi:hypothetical protein
MSRQGKRRPGRAPGQGRQGQPAKGRQRVAQTARAAAAGRPSTPEGRAARRAAHWRRTGVSESTIAWMRRGGWL